MSCVTLEPSVQGCVNIPIIQGDNNDFVFDFDSSVNLSDYEIILDVKQTQDANIKPIFRKIDGDGLTISGNTITVHFGQEMYARNWRTLVYDILFIRLSDDWQEHWIKGNITITSSTTKS